MEKRKIVEKYLGQKEAHKMTDKFVDSLKKYENNAHVIVSIRINIPNGKVHTYTKTNTNTPHRASVAEILLHSIVEEL